MVSWGFWPLGPIRLHYTRKMFLKVVFILNSDQSLMILSQFIVLIIYIEGPMVPKGPPYTNIYTNTYINIYTNAYTNIHTNTYANTHANHIDPKGGGGLRPSPPLQSIKVACVLAYVLVCILVYVLV